MFTLSLIACVWLNTDTPFSCLQLPTHHRSGSLTTAGSGDVRDALGSSLGSGLGSGLGQGLSQGLGQGLGLVGLRGHRKRAASGSVDAKDGEGGRWSGLGATGSPDDVCQSCFGKFHDDKNGEEWIQCLSCRSWYHAKCQGLQAYLHNFQCMRCKPPQG